MAKVVELNYYVVKGCAATSVRAAMVTPAGLTHDRSFMVTDSGGQYRSQRRDPRLALIHPEITGPRLTLRAAGAGAVSVDVDLAAPRRTVDLFGAPYRGIDQGDEVAEWFSDVLGKPSRLVRVPEEHDRITDGLHPGTSGYADSSAVHLTSVSSFTALNKRIVDRGEPPLLMTRFRPNIVVDGWDEPHLEDRARRITLGEVELGYTKLAIRCAVAMVDQELGRRVNPEPLRTLADYRRAAGGGVAFGVKFSVLRPGKLAVGDDVIVTSWGESEL